MTVAGWAFATGYDPAAMSNTIRQLELAFAAPVARGHDVAWARLAHPEQARGEILIDSTSGVLYCEDAIRGLFLFPNAWAEPMRRASELGWRVEEHLTGRVEGATVSSIVTGVARSVAIRTALFVVASTPTDSSR